LRLDRKMSVKFKRIGKFFVYIVECNDKTYYTGYTPCLRKRITLHNSGRGAKYTRDRRPVRLVWFQRHRYFKTAFKTELALKKLTRVRKKKLVEGKLVFVLGKKLGRPNQRKNHFVKRNNRWRNPYGCLR